MSLDVMKDPDIPGRPGGGSGALGHAKTVIQAAMLREEANQENRSAARAGASNASPGVPERHRMGQIVWAALREAEQFYNLDQRRITGRRVYVSPWKEPYRPDLREI